LCLSGSALHGAVITTGVWYNFEWDGPVGTPVFNGPGYLRSQGTTLADPGAPPWTFTGNGRLFVEDLFNHGDAFSVLDNGVMIGATAPIVDDGLTCDDDPVVCRADPKISKLLVLLGAGNHSITMTVKAEAAGFTNGDAAFRLDPVPEPAMLELLLLGAGVIGIRAAITSRARRL